MILTCSVFGPSSTVESFSLGRRRVTTTTTRTFTTSALHLHKDDAADRASPLELTAQDMARFTRLQECSVQMPILILDAMLPKQQMTFETQDPKFHKLFDYCLETGTPMGILGLNPTTGRPMNRGVTVDLTNSPAVANPLTKSVRIAVTGQERFEVQGEPWLDDTGSFYMADVEIVEDRYEHMTAQQEAHAQTLAQTLPQLMKEWKRWVLKAKKTDKQGLQRRLKSIGTDMPKDLTQRALWVAAMLNPVPALESNVCIEIRPAMLAASNDYDRTVLAVQVRNERIGFKILQHTIAHIPFL